MVQRRAIDLTNRIDKKYILTVCVFLLASLWAAVIISAESGTSFLKYDAYNANNDNWSDETSYYITIREIRDFVLPQNVRSYNEVEPEKLGYGVYGPTTYIPYVLASLLTGTSSHNYVVYCNLLLILFANIFFVCIAKPKISQLLWLTLIMSFFLPFQRYIWSGMTEGSHCAMAIMMVACGLYLYSEGEKNKRTESFVLGISVFLPVFFGTIRGYQFIFIILPITYILVRMQGKRRIAAILGTLFFFALGLYLYIFVLNKYCSPYYAEEAVEATTQFKDYISSVFKGDFKPLFSEIFTRNKEAITLLIKQIKVGKWHWVSTIGSLIVCVLLTIGLFINEEIKKKKALVISYIVIVLAIMEAIIVMGRFVHMYRYALGIWAGGFYLLCSAYTIKANRGPVISGFVSLLVLMLLVILVCGTRFKFPQVSKENGYNDEELKAVFSQLLPYDENEPWNNTIASGGSVSYLRLLYPSHIANSTCKPSYLIQLIEKDEVKSKYISVIDKKKKQQIIELCDDKYELIYHDYGLRIYKVR